MPGSSTAKRRRIAPGLQYCCWLVLLCCASPAAAADVTDLRAALDQARAISFQQSWQRAQTILDELAPLIEATELREYADFHLLEARHLVLADRSREGLERVMALLALDLPIEHRLRALQFAANVSVLLRQYESAFEFLSAALALESGSPDPLSRIATLNMAAYMFGRVGEHEAGIAFGEQALDLARKMDSLTEACVSLQRLAPVYKWAGAGEQAEQAYRQGIEDCRQVDNLLFVGVLQYGLADLLRPDQPEQARELAEQSIVALQQAVYPLGEFEARMVRAETLHDLGELDQTWLEELAELAAYFADRELWDQKARMEGLKAAIAERNGDWALALAHFREYVQARESFLGRERAMRLAYSRVAFETRLREQEIELLRETARVSQLEVAAASQQRRLRTFGLLSIILGFLLLLSLLVRTLRSRTRFKELSRRDPLSGLANHSWFFEQAQRVLERFRDEQEPGCLVLVAADIDHFKHINDAHGHRVGDEVLGRMARRLREVFPANTLVGRIGGEEFAALVRVTELNQVLECIERFRHPEPAAMRAGDPEVTVSFGLSCYQPGDDIQSLRERADRALYRAKHDGRNCYRLDDSCR